MKKVFEMNDEDLKKHLNAAVQQQPSEFFADQVMERIYKEQFERQNKPSWQDWILMKPVFRYILLALLLLYPSLARTYM